MLVSFMFCFLVSALLGALHALSHLILRTMEEVFCSYFIADWNEYDDFKEISIFIFYF